MYKLLPDAPWGPVDQVLRTRDNASIPFDADNRDYQAYLKWLEAGNTPEPADQVV